MAHFEDHTPYQYNGNSQPGVVHIGWLGRGHAYPKGVVPRELIDMMHKLANEPTELYRGYHVCELCEFPEKLHGRPYAEQWEWEKSRVSNGEIRVTGEGFIYAAPVLITHYIEEHGYLPPTDFLLALEKSQNQTLHPTAHSAS